MDITPSMRYRKVASTHELAPPLFGMFVQFMATTRPDAPDHVVDDWVNAFKTGRVWSRLTEDDQAAMIQIMVDKDMFNDDMFRPEVLNR